MNCDTAFDLMTDANGSRSGALARHFETCTRCRQMQETLAPALDFLAQDESSRDFSSVVRDSATSESGGRQPFVTVDSVRIAEQAASRLAAQAELPRVRRKRLAGPVTRYAAVFAAGLLLAFALVPVRDAETPIPVGQCKRQEAVSEDSERSAEAIRTLAQSCAVCHTATAAPAHDKETSSRRSEFRSDRANSWDWLAPFFREDVGPIDDSRCVAGSNRPAELNAICQRVPPSFAASAMTV
jgi:mono/diheme cytochrome c family protein